MTRFSPHASLSRPLAALLVLAAAAPFAATPALADGWHGRGDWGHPVFVRPAPVYVAPVYAPPPVYYYAPAPQPLYAPPPPPVVYYAPPQPVPAAPAW